ncbi:hypothetical protein TrVE_jg10733 [Triparma verrucosa]|uniref:EF-hand domain-containing protein n=1 Tax=Triparma verrucosa TaxID=1606542 RepID=A0A9W7CB81_9STRA|nr:hypothetical protein TrVE_jg10733 [Triparma verrucosa]
MSSDDESTVASATTKDPLKAALSSQPEDSSTSIVASTMMKLPADQLAKLRADFIAKPGGLTMYQFVSVMLKYSEKQNTLAREATERLSKPGSPKRASASRSNREVVYANPKVPTPRIVDTVADLVELFHQIDVNGDDSMEWDEFTGFIINMAMASKSDFHFHDHWQLRPVTDSQEKTASEDRSKVRCVKWVPEFQRVLVCAGPMIQVYDPYNRGIGDKLGGELGGMQLCGKIFPWDAEENFAYKRRMMRGEDAISCIQCEFFPSLDVICVLTSDLHITFHKAINRNNLMSESVKPAGRVATESQQYVMAWDDGNQHLFTAGCESQITVWKVVAVKLKGTDQNASKYKYTATQEFILDQHTDAIQDLLVVIHPDEGFELNCLCSASLDGTIKVYNLSSLNMTHTLVGHTSGVTTLCYDGTGALYSGGFGYDVFVWDLDAGLSYPLNKLVKGHYSQILKVYSPWNSGRLCSLDAAGKFCWWDVRRNVALENHERCIQCFDCRPHLSSTFTVADGVENALEFSTNGMTLVAASKKIHTFDSVDVRPPEAPPTQCMFNDVGFNFISIHEKDLKVWDPDTGYILREVTSLSSTEITKIVFDGKQRKAIIANQGGEIQIFNNSNWSKIAELPKHDAEISCLLYAEEDKCIITGSWDRSIRVYDDFHNDPKSSLLRTVTNAHDSDFTALANSPTLGLVATGSVDGSVKIWDFQFLTLDSDAELETDHEVTALSFVAPYPLVLSADSDGGISMIPVRPYLGTGRNKCALRFENGGSGGFRAKPGDDGSIDPVEEANCQTMADNAEERCAACVMTVLYDPDGGEVVGETGIPAGQHIVITGDEHGWVRVWDISPAIKSLELKVPSTDKIPRCMPSYNPYRRCERDGNTYKQRVSDESEAKKGGDDDDGEAISPNSRKKLRKTVPKFDTNFLTDDDVTLLCAWPAHKEALTSVDFISDPKSILTASRDGTVMLWKMDGEEMGTLTRGREADSMWKRDWTFPIDKKARSDTRLTEAREVYDGVVAMETEDRIISKKHEEMVKEMKEIRARTPTSKQSSRPRSKAGDKSPKGRSSPSRSSTTGSPTHHFPAPDGEEKKEDGVENVESEEEEEGEEEAAEEFWSDEESVGHGPKNLVGAQWEEEKDRLFGQVRGDETWVKTAKEMLREKVMSKRVQKTKAIFKKLAQQDKKDDEDPYKIKKKKKKKRRRKGLKKGDSLSDAKKGQEEQKRLPGQLKKSALTRELTMREMPLPSDDDIMSSLDSLNNIGQGGKQGGELFSSMKAHNIVIDTDADDPENWAISSTNRQKEMYGNLYDEKSRLDMAARRSIIAKEQLVATLSQPSDFIRSKEGELEKVKLKKAIIPSYRLKKRAQDEDIWGEGLETNDSYENNDFEESGFYDEQHSISAPELSPLPPVEGIKQKRRAQAKVVSRAHQRGTFFRHNDHTTTGKITAHSLQDLEKMAEETVENQQRWKKRIADFHGKVFGDKGGRARGGAKGRSNKLQPLTAKASSGGGGKSKSRGELGLSKLKNEALQKHRLRMKEGKGASRKESIVSFHNRLRDAKFFGPYSVKEIVLVAEIFGSIVLNLKKKRTSTYTELEKERKEASQRAKEALGQKAPVHLFFSDPDITARPHFVSAIQTMAQHEGHKDRGRVNLETVFRNVFPYLKKAELLEALEYVNLPEEVSESGGFGGGDGGGGGSGEDGDDNAFLQGAPESKATSNPLSEEKIEEKIEQLAELFELYDADGNGVVDVEEIKQALNINEGLQQDRKRRGSTIVDQEDSDMNDVERIMATVSKNSSGELNFDQFVELFSDLF